MTLVGIELSAEYFLAYTRLLKCKKKGEESERVNEGFVSIHVNYMNEEKLYDLFYFKIIFYSYII